MSDSQEVVTNVLLPTAKVALFVRDQNMGEIVAALKNDWRFTRVTFDLHDGDVDAAIGVYSKNASPNLVIVETEEIGDAFTSRLEVLAHGCSENTSAVVIGPVNDVYLYRRLIDMGVSDYLVRPIEKNVLVELIAKILIEKLGTPGSRLIVLLGSKGGVGTSTIAQAMAMSAAHDLGQKTVILDAAGGRSYLSVAMGTEAITTLHEVSRVAAADDQDSLRRMVVNIDEHLSVLATGAESILDGTVTPEQFEGVLNKLMVTFPTVIVDLSLAPVSLVSSVLGRAHEVVVVSTPTLPSLRSARSLIQEVKTLRGGAEQGIHLVLNQKGAAHGLEVSEEDVETALKFAPQLVMAWLPKVFSGAESAGKPLYDFAGAKEIWPHLRKFLIEGLKLPNGSSSPSDGSGTPAKGLGSFFEKLKNK
ncbi:MAG: type II secretion protein ATPase [Alphaproteobacteria bacterium]|nr:type II secretion protein ATPase [Alphaproteobacteria bacterium]